MDLLNKKPIKPGQPGEEADFLEIDGDEDGSENNDPRDDRQGADKKKDAELGIELEYDDGGGSDNDAVKKRLKNKYKKIKKQKVNIGKYRDPEGLSVQKMEIGLWLVEHRRHMLLLLYAFIVFIIVATWSRFFFTFGRYIAMDMNDDHRMLARMVEPNLASHDFLVARAPADLIVGSPQILKTNNSSFDLFVKVRNPNGEYWVHFDYVFSAGSKELERSNGFALPGQERYIISLNRDLGEAAGRAVFNIENVRWTLADQHKYSDWDRFYDDHLDFPISESKYTPAQASILSEKVHLNDLSFTIENNNAYNYYEVDMNVLLISNGRVVGVNRLTLDEFMAEDKRRVNLTWPGILPPVTDIEVRPVIDITRDDIYIKF